MHAQSCLTLGKHMDFSPPGSSVHGILLARILVCHFLLQGIFLTQGSHWCLQLGCIAGGFFYHQALGSPQGHLLLLFSKVESDSFVTLWTVAHQTPLSVGFSRRKYWSGLPLPSPGDLSDPEIKPAYPALSGRFFTTEPPGKPAFYIGVGYPDLYALSVQAYGMQASFIFIPWVLQVLMSCLSSEIIYPCFSLIPCAADISSP